VSERKPRFLVGWVEPLNFVGFRASTQPTKINHLEELNLSGRNPTNRFNSFSFGHYVLILLKPKLSDFLLDLHQSLAHQGLAKSLDISIGMPTLFTNLAASRSWHISSQKIAQLS
jgi:hypothetical protein